MDFVKEYKKLNPAQKEAVDTLNGPVMVIAGPGTGKTQILTMRIANILKTTDADPSNILALTFTESGVKAMRERLISLIGEQAYFVNINTFHSFASQIIAENPDTFLMTKEYNVLNDLERLNVIQSILDKGKFEFLKPANSPFFYTNFISSSISTLKREGVTYKEFAKLTLKNQDIITEITNSGSKKANDLKQIKELKKQLELKTIYKQYQKEIKKIKRYDYEDLINFVVQEFLKKDLLLKTYQEKFQYILIDEFQDTNNAQYQIAKLLTSYWENPDIFTVGDDDQSIFRFQGASVENMLKFLSDFKNTTVINLTANYRSTQNVLDTSRNLITNNNQSIENTYKQISKKLSANTKLTNTKINFLEFSNGILETYYVAKQIEKDIKQGADPSEIAVIYRHNKDAEDFEHIFSKLGIKYNIEGGGNILEDKYIKMFLKLLEAIEKIKVTQEDLDLFTLLNYEFLNFDYVDNLKIARFASKKKTNFFEALQHKEFTQGKVIENHEKYTNLITKQIPEWINVDAENTFTKTFETILNESGFLNYALNQPNYEQILNKINTLYDNIQVQVSSNNNLNLADYLNNIKTYNENYLKINEKDLDIKSKAVTLTTAHKSKGLEFKTVYIVMCTNSKWGGRKMPEYIPLPQGIVNNQSKDNLEEERRLFYVALTRAKQNLYISFSNQYSNSLGTAGAEKSIFITELKQDLVKKYKPENLEDKELIKQAQAMFLTKAPSLEITPEESELLKELINNYKLSVTGLNTYIDCGYKFKLNSILKTPRAKAPYLALGTAVHKALEDYYRELKDRNKTMDDNFLCAQFEKALNKEILTDKEREIQLNKGKKILKAYYKFYKDKLVKPEFLERNFGQGFSKIYLNDVPLTGKVDRIELIKKEGLEKYVRVVDYKTGRMKSRNEIEGKTKNSNGHEKRQLVFYKLLCDLDKSFNMNAIKFELDYVGDGKIETKPRKHEFEITKQEVETLKKEVIENMNKIRSFNFDRTTDYSICQNCDYKDHCWPEGVPKTPLIKQGSLNI